MFGEFLDGHRIEAPWDDGLADAAVLRAKNSFVGRASGVLQAYDDLSGKLLWTSPKLLAGVNAAPITYSANGRQ